MLTGSEKEKRTRWLSASAFIALSLPLVLVGPRQDVPLAATSAAPAPSGVSQPVNFLQAQDAGSSAKSQTPAAAKPTRRKRIVVSIPERRLAMVAEGRVVKTYSIAVGADVSPSPTGEFKITTKVTNPTYYRPGKVIAAGAENPLGSRWLGLDREHYGIHGTNEPDSIGRAASHGCIRMAKSDVEELFAAAQIGDTVEISEEPLQQLAQLDDGSQGTTIK